jgi:glutamate synthase domain-containing protein 3
LGEYLAGGLIVVLGIGADGVPVGDFTGTGMHGGKIFIRTNHELAPPFTAPLPAQVIAEKAGGDDMKEIAPYIGEFCEYFGMDARQLMKDQFYVLRPNAKNPYKQLYVAN